MSADPIQNLFNELSAGWKAQRSLSQMTLGKLIAKLESLPPKSLIEKFDAPHSYRGYYSDLAFEPYRGGRFKAISALTMARECLGKTFEGYKGGDYVMDENTPLWLACYGSTGVKIMDIDEQGNLVTEKEE